MSVVINYLQITAKCIIDGHTGCLGKLLHGVPIVGDRDKILDAVRLYNIDEIIFAIPSVDPRTKKEMLEICRELGCKMRMLPGEYHAAA